MHLSTLACAAGLLAALEGVSYANVVLTTDPTGFTNQVFLSAVSPFTDTNGNTATMVNLPGSSFEISAGSTDTFMVAFAHPVEKAGFDLGVPGGSNQGPFHLSNGDSTASSSCSTDCFLGVTDTTPFTSFSIMITAPSNSLGSAVQIQDFRYTSASVPEPAGGTLVAPLLIAAFAALRLKRLAK